MYLDLLVLSDKGGNGGQWFSQVGVILTQQIGDQLRHSNGGLYKTRLRDTWVTLATNYHRMFTAGEN